MRIFFCVHSSNKKIQWLLTEDELIARATDQSYSLASLKDLHDWVAATGQVFTGILTILEGKCKWTESTSVDELGFEDYYCGYELI
ncbi:hypothetical protein EEL31_10540 [Brevibacillus laterosporus]|nr:hypothetical protein [Brevibacillus laterosporus]TPG68923.1 hypothetical protein EEL31_10540 [Brevibacillus laterosporus]